MSVGMSNVLVVDDDVGIRKVVTLTLRLEGAEVCEASDGLEALEILSQEQVDLVILDLEMPRMDGRETFLEARREGYEGPVMILSGYGARVAAEALSADDALDKPFDPEELVSHVRRLLRPAAKGTMETRHRS